jgi:hypothetical protein
VSQKRPQVSVALALVARSTGRGEVGDTIRASPATGDDVVDLERHTLCIAVDTATPPFLEQIPPNFVAEQRALLILDPRDLWMLKLLCIEAYQLELHAAKRNAAAEALAPSLDIADSASEGWRQPTQQSPPIVKPGSAVA